MTISIIIPIYNTEKYIQRCLDSVLVHNHFVDEVICIDDGSTDKSGTILKEYAIKYPNLRVVTQKNLGLSVVRNVGLQIAQGDYVYFLDSDDYLLPGTIERIIDKLSLSPEVELLCCNAEKSDQTFYYPLGEQLNGIVRGTEFVCFFRNTYRSAYVAPVWLYVYKRQFLLGNNLQFEPNLLHEDELFTPQALLCARSIAHLNIPIVYHLMQREGAITSKVTDVHLRHFAFINRQLNQLYSDSKGIDCSCFRETIFTNYISCLGKSLMNKIPFDKWFSLKDRICMKKNAQDVYQKKIAVLAFCNPALSIKYYNNHLSLIGRKLISYALWWIK